MKKKRKTKHLIIQRNYLIWLARDLLKMDQTDIAEVFNCTRQTVISVLKQKEGSSSDE